MQCNVMSVVSELEQSPSYITSHFRRGTNSEHGTPFVLTSCSVIFAADMLATYLAY